MNIKVAKFGGSSLASAGQFRKVKDILLSDPERKYVVPSAPGRRFKDDIKVTDLLYQCFRLAEKGQCIDECFAQVAQRYQDIIRELELDLDLTEQLEDAKKKILSDNNPDYAASRGEYFNGIILAKYMGWDFIDSADIIKFDKHGRFAAEWTNDQVSRELKHHEHAVIPGFYGSFPDGTVKTFSRGGSDITGAIVARAAEAVIYENWTDVDGFMMADPRIIENPRYMKTLTYRELRELSYMGATVLHEDAIFPVRKAGIPTNIRNTNNPSAPGTMIVMSADQCEANDTITGVAGHKNFALLSIEKAMMNSELGFGRRVLQALEEFGVSFEHLPTGIDTMCVIIADSEIAKHGQQIIDRINETCHPDSIDISSNLALIATVGRGIIRKRGTASRLFRALAVADVNVRIIDQGSSELNIIVGVDCDDFEKAVSAIYYEFV